MTQQVWDEGIRSVNEFLSMIKEHPRTGSSTQASKLLVSAIFGEGNFSLNRMSNFDLQNCEHALNILKAICYHAADFRTAVAKAHAKQFTQIRKELAQCA
nr:hypothetical protein [uncultured Limnohabitans sp.]